MNRRQLLQGAGAALAASQVPGAVASVLEPVSRSGLAMPRTHTVKLFSLDAQGFLKSASHNVIRQRGVWIDKATGERQVMYDHVMFINDKSLLPDKVIQWNDWITNPEYKVYQDDTDLNFFLIDRYSI
jgi:hypothetical protein